MSPSEIRSIAETMRECGITHLKTSDLEMTHQPPALAVTKPAVVSSPLSAPSIPETWGASLSKEEKDPSAIEHKIEQLTSLMKLSDADLVDNLFPDHTAQTDEESA